MADVFNAEVTTLRVSEGAAYGAALQALWSWQRDRGEKTTIEDITDEFVTLNRAETARPNRRAVEVYAEMQALQDEVSVGLRSSFARHRRLVTR